MTTPQNLIRAGCQDEWYAFLVDGADFTLGSDIPYCPCTANDVPKELILYGDAKSLHKKNILQNPNYHINAFVHFYEDDHKFNGPREGILAKPNETLEMLRHFGGAISPDFSTNADFPDPIKRYNTYLMRAYGRWLAVNGIPIINNVRWGTAETWTYCFDGIPYNSIVAIGTVASGINRLENRPHFEEGLFEMVRLLNPRSIIVYGSSRYTFFDQLREQGIDIITFPSKTSLAFAEKKKGGKTNETQ